MKSSMLVEHRAKDVLFALALTTEREAPAGRLTLQKFIYLFDVLALVWRDVGAVSTFRPWHNGPYDYSIQNAVDVLAFRGHVEIESFSVRKLRNTECKYLLTKTGKKCVDNLRANPSFGDDFDLFSEIATEIDKPGWDKIRRIVYSEPTYCIAKAMQLPLSLPLGSIEGNLSSKILRNLRRGLEFDRAMPISRIAIVQMFFSILERYRTLPEVD